MDFIIYANFNEKGIRCTFVRTGSGSGTGTGLGLGSGRG